MNALIQKLTNSIQLLLSFVIALLIGVGNTQSLQAQGVAEAARLAQQGEYEQAEYMFHQLIKQHPDDIPARIGSAYNNSWQGKYARAEQEFRLILEEAPEHEEALLGLGYTLAWAEKYRLAKSPFKRILGKNATHTEAQKGLAYVYLWQGRGAEAARRFKHLLDKSPYEVEYHLSLGQAYLLAGKTLASRKAFEQARSLAPERREIQGHLRAVQLAPAFLEIDGWGGLTRFKQNNKWGLRALQIKVQAMRNLSLWARYDNSLTLDNLSLIQKNQGAGAWFVGGYAYWHPQLGTRLEAGYRSIPEIGEQWLMQGEQVVYLKEGKVIKTGGFVALNPSLPTEWTAYAGIHLPLNSAFAIEPTYFHSRPGPSQANEHRLLLTAKYSHPQKWQVSLGGLAGRTQYLDEALSGNLYGGYMMAMVPLGDIHWIQVLSRYEKGIIDDFFTLALGFKFRLEK